VAADRRRSPIHAKTEGKIAALENIFVGRGCLFLVFHAPNGSNQKYWK
jgi:hypothetical protein